MFTAGSVSRSEEGDIPIEKKPEHEKTTIEKLAHSLWHVLNRKERAENEKMESRRHPSVPGEEDFGERLRKLEGRYDDLGNEPRNVNFGNQGPDRNEVQRNRAVDVLLKTIGSIAVLAIVAAVSFLYGRVWDHETRISHLEGESAHAQRSP